MNKFRRAQSTLEYVIILAAIIGAVIIIAGSLKKKMDFSYKGLSQSMEDKAKEVEF